MNSPIQLTAVILDLFGTLVPAPDSHERERAVREIAAALDVSERSADRALKESWRSWRDGTLRTTTAIAEHLAAVCGAPVAHVPRVESTLRRLAPTRLHTDTTVPECMADLRRAGLRLGLLSDADPDVVEAWDDSMLVAQFDAVQADSSVAQPRESPLIRRPADRRAFAVCTVRIMLAIRGKLERALLRDIALVWLAVGVIGVSYGAIAVAGGFRCGCRW
ncbi:hypothetical protein [Kitasatospora sp. LaBMicrA B282]|uniref:hypothetical protein n=1 Tax=Kitasatospora sp. LaBMicrA B282 TaxID=3420949 RepID=UPI003D0A687E